jgi:hypothetical protein
MSDHDPNRTTVVTSSGGNGGLYFVVGMLLVAVLVGAYILMGAPGLHNQVANAPGSGQKIDVTVQQPATPAPATPAAPAAPAPARR